MLKAKDIMTENVVSVKKDTPIYEALDLLVKYNITGIPVVREDMILVGVLSEKDVLRLFYAHEDEEEGTVNDFMTQPAVHFDAGRRLIAKGEHDYASKSSSIWIWTFFLYASESSEVSLSNFLCARKILTAIIKQPAPATENTMAASIAKISFKA